MRTGHPSGTRLMMGHINILMYRKSVLATINLGKGGGLRNWAKFTLYNLFLRPPYLVAIEICDPPCFGGFCDSPPQETPKTL